MGYLDENGLARYDGLIKNWVTLKSGTVDGVDPLLNWQRTGTAGAVTCYPLPAVPIDPTVNFLFSETGPAEGTKGPDNPSTITGVSSVKVGRCGKNLLAPKNSSIGSLAGGVITVTSDGEITVNGTLSAQTNVVFEFPFDSPKIISAGSYMLSANNNKVPSPEVRLSTRTASGGWPTDGTVNGTNNLINNINYTKIITFSANHNAARIYAVFSAGTYDNFTLKPQLELGTIATEFERSDQNAYTIQLGGTYYGGSVDLSTGTMTVTHVSVELDSTYVWPDSGAYNSMTGLKFLQGYGPSIFGESVVEGNSVCSHFVYGITSSAYVEAGTTTSPMYSLVGGGSQMRFAAPFPSASAFMSWLDAQKANGTPVRVTGKLATPFTVPLTPTKIYSLSQLDTYTPRINTVYSDQVSVQVGYPKSPQATSTELTNAIISLGSNL